MGTSVKGNSVKGLLKGLRYISQIFGMFSISLSFSFQKDWDLIDWLIDLMEICRWKGTGNADWASHWR